MAEADLTIKPALQVPTLGDDDIEKEHDQQIDQVFGLRQQRDKSEEPDEAD